MVSATDCLDRSFPLPCKERKRNPWRTWHHPPGRREGSGARPHHCRWASLRLRERVETERLGRIYRKADSISIWRGKLAFHNRVGSLERKWAPCPRVLKKSQGTSNERSQSISLHPMVMRSSEDSEFYSKAGLLIGFKVTESEFQLSNSLAVSPSTSYLTSLGFDFFLHE